MPLEEIISKVDKSRLPRHIAIIMDGNGRWAEQRGLTRVEGHRAGVKTVDGTVSFCCEMGIPALTLYSFSSENWLRPADEIKALMNILKDYLGSELGRMIKENIRFNTIGEIDKLPTFAKAAVKSVAYKTRNNTGMTLTLALSYGGRSEILRAARALAVDVGKSLVKPEQIDEKFFSQYLDTKTLPDPDLLIRTSGELRISNFLLWQIAYAELYFTDKLWPDITANDIAEAIVSFQTRNRRFGKTTTDQTNGKE